MIISSRTPEGSPSGCTLCGSTIRIEPSMLTNDAPCPNCGHLLWFPPNGLAVVSDLSRGDIASLLQVDAEKLPKRLLLNFEGVDFMVSSMIAELIRLNELIKMRGGKLVLCRASVNLREVFKITKVEGLFDIVGDEGDGIDALT